MTDARALDLLASLSARWIVHVSCARGSWSVAVVPPSNTGPCLSSGEGRTVGLAVSAMLEFADEHGVLL